MKLQQSCFFNRTLRFVLSILKIPQMSDRLKEKTKALFAFVSQPQCLLLIGVHVLHKCIFPILSQNHTSVLEKKKQDSKVK